MAFELPKAEQIPLHSIPTPSDALKAFYGETGYVACHMLKEDLESMDKPMWELSNEAVDMSLFPYRVEGPCEPPIPTPAEIAAARPKKKLGDKNVWRVGPYMVKVSPKITPLKEAENLLYLARESTVRVPRVYAAFASKETDVFQANAQRPDFKEGDENLESYYLIMEYIDGVMVDSLAEELEDRPRLIVEIGKKIGEQVRHLRSVEPEDPKHFGRIGGRAYVHMAPFDHAPAPDFSYGPFKSYEECVKRIIHSGKLNSAMGHNDSEFTPLDKALFRDAPSAFLDYPGPSDRRPVLSHMDLQLTNVMVKLIRDKKGEAISVEEVVIVDWETLCWMPSWFEAGAICYLRTNGQHLEFHRLIGGSILEQMGETSMVPVAFFAQCVKRTLHLHYG
ncbi:hypothetical protein N0V90_007624 [Kalmusia sp. IMI 367209]|nr:hypothetical protein N0V90_007624 [Kalmusia sp. IMI 367209]